MLLFHTCSNVPCSKFQSHHLAPLEEAAKGTAWGAGGRGGEEERREKLGPMNQNDIGRRHRRTYNFTTGKEMGEAEKEKEEEEEEEEEEKP